jgi:hypothetical protein
VHGRESAADLQHEQIDDGLELLELAQIGSVAAAGTWVRCSG